MRLHQRMVLVRETAEETPLKLPVCPSARPRAARALPPGVDLAVAESVRFTGCAVRVLTNPRGAYAGRALLPDREVQEAAAAVGELSAAPAFDPAVFGAAIERLRSRAVRIKPRVARSASFFAPPRLHARELGAGTDTGRRSDTLP